MTTQKMTSAIFLRGKMVNLRPIEKTDAPAMQRWMNDPEVRQFLLRVFPLRLHEEEAWIAQERTMDHVPNNVVFAIELHDGTLIGNMGLHGINWISRTAVSGTCLGEKEYWGKGYGTDAKMLLLKYAFDTLGLRKINSYILAYNGRSLGFNKHCGYKEAGRLQKEVLKDGTYHDEVILSVFREDWHPRWEEYMSSDPS